MTNRKFFRVPYSVWRDFLNKNKKSDSKIDSISLADSISDEPIATRVGYNVQDNAPFYESNPEKIFSWYRSYAKSEKANHSLLYTDIIAFKLEEYNPIPLWRALDFNLIEIELKQKKWRMPDKLELHAKLAIDLFKEKKLINKVTGTDEFENNTTMRIDSIDYESALIKACPAMYFDQVGTNITLDWNSGLIDKPATTIRNGIEHPVDHKLKSLEESVLANTLGVAVVFYDKNLSPDIRLRKDDMASIQKQGLHCTCSGVWELPKNYKTGMFPATYFEHGVRKEIKHEVGLEPHEYALFPVCIARELPRGGKPQIFYAAISLVSVERYEQAKRTANEKHEFVDNTDLVDALISLETPHEAFTYEGWAAAIFANYFVEANKKYLQNISKNGTAKEILRNISQKRNN